MSDGFSDLSRNGIFGKGGYDDECPAQAVSTPSRTLSSYSTEELKAEIKRREIVELEEQIREAQVRLATLKVKS